MSDWQDHMSGGSNACKSLDGSTLGEATSHDGIHMIEEAPVIEDKGRWPYSASPLRHYGQIDEAYKSPLKGTSTLHFPVHSACLSLAKKLIEASAKIQSNTPYGGPKSMRQLWDILLSRFWIGCHNTKTRIPTQGLIRWLRDPHNHYLPSAQSLLHAYPKHNVRYSGCSADHMLINPSPLSQILSTFRELRNMFFHFSGLFQNKRIILQSKEYQLTWL
jgi:hypothetical protein